MENEDYFIDFTTTNEGGLDAVRVRLDMIRISKSQMKEKISIDLCNHPLYFELQRYVKANPR